MKAGWKHRPVSAATKQYADRHANTPIVSAPGESEHMRRYHEEAEAKRRAYLRTPRGRVAQAGGLSYKLASVILRNRTSIRLENNTYLHVRYHDDGKPVIAVLLHSTDIATFYPDGSCELRGLARWNTLTTRDRLNRYSPARIGTVKNEPRVYFSKPDGGTDWSTWIPYSEGMRVNSRGTPLIQSGRGKSGPRYVPLRAARVRAAMVREAAEAKRLSRATDTAGAAAVRDAVACKWADSTLAQVPLDSPSPGVIGAGTITDVGPKNCTRYALSIRIDPNRHGGRLLFYYGCQTGTLKSWRTNCAEWCHMHIGGLRGRHYAAFLRAAIREAGKRFRVDREGYATVGPDGKPLPPRPAVLPKELQEVT